MGDWWSFLVATGTKGTDSHSITLAITADRSDGFDFLASTISDNVIFVSPAIDA
jgi:hypothetical protein